MVRQSPGTQDSLSPSRRGMSNEMRRTSCQCFSGVSLSFPTKVAFQPLGIGRGEEGGRLETIGDAWPLLIELPLRELFRDHLAGRITSSGIGSSPVGGGWCSSKWL